MTRRQAVRVAVTVAVGLVLCTGVAAITYRANSDETSAYHPRSDGRAVVGHVYTGDDLDDDPTLATVLVPTGALHLTVSTRVTGVDDTSGSSSRYNLKPPAGGSLVAVDAYLDGTASSLPAEVALSRGTPAARLTVRTPRGTYPVQGSGAVLAVDGDARQGRLEVEFGGVTQTVDLRTGAVGRGRAAGLYRTPASGRVGCGPATFSAHYRGAPGSTVRCRVDWRRVPYLPGLGWAPAGHSFLLAALTVAGPSLVERVDGSARVVARTTRFDTSRTVRCGATRVVTPGTVDSYGSSKRDATRILACPTATAAAGRTALAIRETVSGFTEQGADYSTELTWSVTV